MKRYLFPSQLSAILGALVLFASANPGQLSAASVGESVSAAAESTKASIEEASNAAADKIAQIWQQIDAQRLVNRTRDEIVAWVIMGVLVGAVVGLFSVLRISAFQRFWALAMGLIGAFIGGIVAHVAQLDFGMGPVLIRYEDLLLSLIGGLLLVLAFKFYSARRKGKV